MYMTKLPWWRHQMETFFALLAFCMGNSPELLCGEFTGGEFPTQRPVTRSFDVFFDLHLNKQLSKQPRGWWFETPSGSLWHQCDGNITISFLYASVVVLWSLSSKHYNLLSDNFYCNLYEKTVVTPKIFHILYIIHSVSVLQNITCALFPDCSVWWLSPLSFSSFFSFLLILLKERILRKMPILIYQ